jgi:hypothetical protein
MQKESFDKFHEAIERLYRVEAALLTYSEAMRTIGNDSLAERLEFMAFDIRKCNSLVSEATGESLGDCIRQSGEATENMLLATLGVCGALGAKNSEEKHPKAIEE